MAPRRRSCALKLGKFKVSTDIGKGQDAEIHGFIVKPPQFDPTKKYPMIVLIHGGPQGAWFDSWAYRWNPQMFAARGYVVVLINPHGSTGYGQAFTEEISGDWGGAVYEDLMKGVDYVVKQGYVDPTRIGAAGGIVRRLYGQLAPRPHRPVQGVRFARGRLQPDQHVRRDRRALVPRVGIQRPAVGEPELYEKWSPHLFAENFKTPTLVVHGELDYRVPWRRASAFTTLQRKGVPSKLLYFPDEGHWVLKPQNSELWYKTVMDWFDQWLKPGGMTATR